MALGKGALEVTADTLLDFFNEEATLSHDVPADVLGGDALRAIRDDDAEGWLHVLGKAALPFGTSVLGAVLANQSRRILQLLLELYPDCVHETDADGWHGLHVCAALGLHDEASLLLEKRANAHARTTCGETPLELSRRRQHVAVEELLMAVDDSGHGTQQHGVATHVAVTPAPSEINRHPHVPLAARPQYVRPAGKISSERDAVSKAPSWSPEWIPSVEELLIAVPNPLRNSHVTFSSTSVPPAGVSPSGTDRPHGPARGHLAVMVPGPMAPPTTPQANYSPSPSIGGANSMGLSPSVSIAKQNWPVPPPSTPCGETPSPRLIFGDSGASSALAPTLLEKHALLTKGGFSSPVAAAPPFLRPAASQGLAFRPQIPALRQSSISAVELATRPPNLPLLIDPTDTVSSPHAATYPSPLSLPPLRPSFRGSGRRTRKGSRSSSPISPYAFYGEAPYQRGQRGDLASAGSSSASRPRSSVHSHSRPTSHPLPNTSPSVESQCSLDFVLEKRPRSSGHRIAPNDPNGSHAAMVRREKAARLIQRIFRARPVRSWIHISIQGCGNSLKWTFGSRGATVSNFAITEALLADSAMLKGTVKGNSTRACVMKGDRLFKINNVCVLNMPKNLLKGVWKRERGAGATTALRVVRPG